MIVRETSSSHRLPDLLDSEPFMDIARDFVNNPAAKGSSIAKDMAKLANEHLTEVLPVPISPTQVEVGSLLITPSSRRLGGRLLFF